MKVFIINMHYFNGLQQKEITIYRKSNKETKFSVTPSFVLAHSSDSIVFKALHLKSVLSTV